MVKVEVSLDVICVHGKPDENVPVVPSEGEGMVEIEARRQATVGGIARGPDQIIRPAKQDVEAEIAQQIMSQVPQLMKIFKPPSYVKIQISQKEYEDLGKPTFGDRIIVTLEKEEPIPVGNPGEVS